MEKAMNDYLTWEIGLVDDVARDGTAAWLRTARSDATMRDWPEVRDAVAKLCERFPPETTGARWTGSGPTRPSSCRRSPMPGISPSSFPRSTAAAELPVSAAAAVLEEIHRAGCNGAACHAQMYTMGTVLRYGSDAQKQRWLPGIASGELRLQAFGVTEPSSGSNTLALRTTAVKKGNSHYVVNGQKVWTSRAEHSDLMLLLARTTPAAEVKKRTEGLSVFLVDMRKAKGNGLEIRPIRTMINHSTTEIFFDDLEIPADSLIGEEGRGFRYILDGMNAERVLIASECIGDARWFIDKASRYATERQVFGRPIGRNQGIQFPHRRGIRRDRGGGADVPARGVALRIGRAVRGGGEHGEAARLGGVVAGGGHVHADPRRIRLRRGVRHRAQVPRDEALPHRPDLEQPGAELPRRARARTAALVLTHWRVPRRTAGAIRSGRVRGPESVKSPGWRTFASTHRRSGAASDVGRTTRFQSVSVVCRYDRYRSRISRTYFTTSNPRT